MVKSSSTFSRLLKFGSKRSEEENTSSSSEEDEMDSKNMSDVNYLTNCQ